MSTYPPPPPAGPPPPQAGGGPRPYGARAGFDPKSVNPMDWGILAAGLLALVFSFFKYYSYDAKADAGCSAANGDICSISNSAWHGFFGWFGVLLAVVGAAAIAIAILAPQVALPVPARLIGVGGLGLGAVSTLLALAVTPDGTYRGVTIPSDNKEVDAGTGWAYWVVLVLILIGLVLAILRLQQTGGARLSSVMGGGGRPAGGQPQGYGQSQGYGAPQGPPPGYGPPPQAPPPGYGPPPQAPPPGYGLPPQAPPPGYGPPPQAPPQGPPTGYGPPPQAPPQGPPTGYGPPPQAPPQGPPPQGPPEQ